MIGELMIMTFVVGALVAHRTRFGQNVYALGGGESTARLMGGPLASTTIGVYAISGGLADVVFLLYTSAGYSLATVGV